MFFNRPAFLGQVPIAGLGQEFPVKVTDWYAYKQAQKAAGANICDIWDEHDKAPESEQGSWKASFAAAAKAYADKYVAGDLEGTYLGLWMDCPPKVRTQFWNMLPRSWKPVPKPVTPTATPVRPSMPTATPPVRPSRPTSQVPQRYPTIPTAALAPTARPGTSAAFQPVQEASGGPYDLTPTWMGPATPTAQCGPSQFWDGVKCRGSISAIPGGIPTGSSGGAIGPTSSFAPMTSPSSVMTGKVRFPVVNLRRV